MIQNEHLTKIFKATPLPSLLLLTDAPRFTIEEVNDAYIKVTGVKESDLIGRGIFEAFPDNSNGVLDHLNHSLLQVIGTGKSHKMTVQRYDLPVWGTEEYEARYWNPENIPVLDDSKAIYIIHTVQDITAEVTTSARLNNNVRIIKEG